MPFDMGIKDYLAPGRAEPTTAAQPMSERRRTSFFQDYLAPGRTPEAKAAVEYRKTRMMSMIGPPQPVLMELNEKESDGGGSTGSSNEFAEKEDVDVAVNVAYSSDEESRPVSQMYPSGDFRNNGPEDLRDIKCDVMVNWLYQQQMEMLWTAGEADEGVVLKKAKGNYTCCPPDIMDEPFGFFRAIESLNVKVSQALALMEEVLTI